MTQRIAIMVWPIVLILAGSANGAEPTALGNRQITLNLPSRDKLPALPNAHRFQVWDSIKNNDGWPLGHAAVVSVFKNRIVCVWYSTTKYEAQDYPRKIKVLTSSAPVSNLEDWTLVRSIEDDQSRNRYFTYLKKKYNKDNRVGETPDADGRYIFVPRGMLVAGDQLILFTLSYQALPGQSVGRIFTTKDGIHWNEMEPEILDRKKLFTIRDSSFNHHAVRLQDGRLMAPVLNQNRMHAPTTNDVTGLSGWQGGLIDSTACADVGEPAGWQGPDGAIHFVARYGRRVWHAYSTDNGKTYTKLEKQPNFTDSPANKEFGSMQKNGAWYVGNPYPNDHREYLVFATSQNGWDFDNTWKVRWEKWQDRNPPARINLGYDYPSGVFYNGRIYLLYSTDNRQRIELTVAPIPNADER